MPKIPVTARNRVRRLPKRGHYDRDVVNAIIDEALVCHVAFAVDGVPTVTPTLHARRGDSLLLGSLPFWLVAVPATALLTLYRHTLAAAWRARLVRATPRRRRRPAATRVSRSGRGVFTSVRAGVVPARHAQR